MFNKQVCNLTPDSNMKGSAETPITQMVWRAFTQMEPSLQCTVADMMRFMLYVWIATNYIIIYIFRIGLKQLSILTQIIGSSQNQKLGNVYV